MRAAIIGCGNIAGVHAKNLRVLGIPLTLVVDPNEEALRTFESHWGPAQTHNRWERVLDSDADSVHICTPPALHYEMVRSCLEHGKHVLCEKPLCLHTDEARELTELAEAKGLVGAVNFNVSYYPAMQEAIRIIGSPAFGEPILVQGSYLQGFHILPTEVSWRYQEQLAGPLRAVTEIGSHLIDLVVALTGRKIRSVSARLQSLTPKRVVREGTMYPDPDGKSEEKRIRVDSDDLAVISFEMEGGLLGTLVLSEVSHGRVNQVRVEISGKNKNLWWDSEECARLMVGERETGITETRYPFDGGFPDSFLELARAYYKAVTGGQESGKELYPGFRRGWENLKVCNAILESSRQNGAWRPVE